MTAAWWHPLPAPEEQDDDGLIVCPHCQQQGCARCKWAGVIERTEDGDAA